jgi:capsular polysaccharide export protein
MFHIPGLTFQGKLDAFWSSAQPPDQELCEAFLKCIASTIQIKGGFFSRDGLCAIVSEAALRLDRELVNKPLFERTKQALAPNGVLR